MTSDMEISYVNQKEITLARGSMRCSTHKPLDSEEGHKFDSQNILLQMPISHNFRGRQNYIQRNAVSQPGLD